MSNKQIFVVVVYFLMFGCWGLAFGHHVGAEQQSKINNQLRIEYDELKANYDSLEIEYNWRLEACYTQLGDMQDDYDVNNDGVVDAIDYVAIKQYIMNQ